MKKRRMKGKQREVMEEAMEETTNTLYVKQKRNRNGTTMDKRISCAIKARKEGR